MRRYWWTVWIKVAVVAFVLFLGYQYISNKIEDIVSPYIIEETQTAEEGASDDSTDRSKGNFVMKILGKIEDRFDVKIDFENMIFDYADEYALKLKEQVKEEKNVITEPLS